MKKIGILGSTGSVGTQALEIIEQYPDKFELIFISGHTNLKKLMEQKNRFKPKFVCISDDKAYKVHKRQNLTHKNISGGYDGLLELCNMDTDIVLNSIMGYKGLYMSIKLIENKIDLALSNKESIVQAGSILTKLAKEKSKYFPCR